jgi:hypothetical protein
MVMMAQWYSPCLSGALLIKGLGFKPIGVNGLASSLPLSLTWGLSATCWGWVYCCVPNKTRGCCVTHFVTLPFTLQSILRQKKNYYGNSNISPMQKYYLPKVL